MNIIEQLLQRGDLVAKTNGVVFKRPTKILVRASAIDQIKAVYRKDSETGGVMKLRPTDTVGSFVINEIEILQNKSANTNTKFDPDAASLGNAINRVLNLGNIPIIFHTHPTSTGHSQYDHKRQNFYVGSSAPDREAANGGFVLKQQKILMPEVIFVGDSRFVTDYKISFYSGGILPGSYLALSRGEIIAVSAAVVAMLLYGRPLLIIVAAIFAIEEFRRPKYDYYKDGSVLVSFRNFL